MPVPAVSMRRRTFSARGQSTLHQGPKSPVLRELLPVAQLVLNFRQRAGHERVTVLAPAKEAVDHHHVALQ
jgi:hypothetical protein